MDTPRSVFKVDKNNPGSDIAGETAATLAAASIVFRKCDPSYSSLLLQRAITVNKQFLKIHFFNNFFCSSLVFRILDEIFFI